MPSISKIGFGGGCHWCTEAFFGSLRGVKQVDQGWINSVAPHDSFSEAVIVQFDPDLIPIETLISIHLHTHACTANHNLRERYRSAVYVFDADDLPQVAQRIAANQPDFPDPIITHALPFSAFRPNEERYQNYFEKNRNNEFCLRYIHPKLEMLQQKYAAQYQEQ